MTSQRPPATAGMRHIALNVTNMAETEYFYVELLGMQVEWRPDPDNVYLTSGNDNLALHRVDEKPTGSQHLDHLGFILARLEDVDPWYDFLLSHNIEIFKPPRTHQRWRAQLLLPGSRWQCGADDISSTLSLVL